MPHTRADTAASPPGEATADLLAKLRDRLGAAHVLTGADAAPYERDWTGAYRGCAAAVLRPADTGEVAAIMRLAYAAGAPVVTMGGNSGLSGGTYAGTEGAALIVSLERMDRIHEINAAARTARVEAGVIIEQVHAAADDRGLVFPLQFAAKGSARIGGALATNAGGSNVLRYGNTRALCLGIEAVTASGEVIDLMGGLYKDNTGYALKDLLIGSEGTLGVITGAVLRLHPKPAAYATAFAGMTDLSAALALLHELQDATGGAVEAFEYMPAGYFTRFAEAFPDRRLPFADPAPVNLLIEIGATARHLSAPGGDGRIGAEAVLADTLAAAAERGGVTDAVLAQTEAQRAAFWAVREASLELLMTRAPLLTTDVSLPLDCVAAFLARMDARLAAIAPGAEALPVAHLGDGNVHYAVWPDPEGSGTGADRTAEIAAAVEDGAVALGGSFSAEHGVGLSKRAAMGRAKDPGALAAMRAVKAALDPGGILNPGKVLP